MGLTSNSIEVLSCRRKISVANKKVVHLINDLGLGGAQRVVAMLCEHSLSGFETSVLTLTDRGDFFSVASTGVRVLHVAPLKNWKKALNAIFSADVLHVHLFPALYVGAIFTKASVYTEHSTSNRRRRHRLLRPIERAIYNRYDKIACISDGVKRMLLEWLGEDFAPKAVVIQNGVNITETYQRKVPNSNVMLGMMGRFSIQKDQSSLVRALSILPSNYSVSFAGSGPEQPAVWELAKSLGVNTRVEFLGDVTETTEFLKNISIYVQSSHWEGFGLAAAEAMALGTPCIGTDVAGLREVIGRPDFLFPPGDFNALADRILQICHSDDSYLSASRFSTLRAKNFSFTNTSKEYEKLYAEVFRYS